MAPEFVGGVIVWGLLFGGGRLGREESVGCRSW